MYIGESFPERTDKKDTMRKSDRSCRDLLYQMSEGSVKPLQPNQGLGTDHEIRGRADKPEIRPTVYGWNLRRDKGSSLQWKTFPGACVFSVSGADIRSYFNSTWTRFKDLQDQRRNKVGNRGYNT